MNTASLQWEIEELNIRVEVFILTSGVYEHQGVGSAAMLVPIGRENDWIFSTEPGQLQLLASSCVPKLVLLIRAGNSHGEHANRKGEEWHLVKDNKSEEALKQHLEPLLLALTGTTVPFMCYEDNIVWRKVVEKAYSHRIGEMLVEDVRLLDTNHLRRRLRFKSMPNLIQTEVPLSPSFVVNHSELVHVYLAPLVAGLCLISRTVQTCVESGELVRVLCIGVGGGALPMFLNTMESFHVEAVDIDRETVNVAKQHFGLVENKKLRVHVEDGLLTVDRIVSQVKQVSGRQETDRTRDTSRKHVIVVDVSAGDGLSCPTPAFLERRFFLNVKMALRRDGVFMMNVMPRDGLMYKGIVNDLAGVFKQVYEIEINDGENYAVFALVSPCEESDYGIINKVVSLVGEELVNRLHRVA